MSETLRELEDWPLVQRCQTGDENAYRVLVERHTRRAYWASYRILGNREDAIDVSQEAFIKVYRSIDRFRPGASFTTWLHRIVVNLTIDHLRKRRTQRGSVPIDCVSEISDSSPSPGSTLINIETGSKIQEVLDKLPPLYRTALILRNVEEKSCKEIAEIVGANYATVRWRLHKARQLFKQAWEKQAEQSERTVAENRRGGHRS